MLLSNIIELSLILASPLDHSINFSCPLTWLSICCLVFMDVVITLFSSLSDTVTGDFLYSFGLYRVWKTKKKRRETL